MNYSEALVKLFSLHQFGIKLGLENIKKLLNHIGNPQHKIKAIHVAGSNGKGSTSSFIASILMESGFKVGLYTSPHFVKFNERIRVNGEMIPDSFIVKFMNNNLEYINRESPTFFELTTAMAFQYFVEQGIDIAVVETGLGGRLDATNVLNSLASVITSISLEHTHILGNDFKSIAKEKAGIIKENQDVFIGQIPAEAANVIESKCNIKKSKLYKIKDYWEIDEEKSLVKCDDFSLTIKNLPLLGYYQLQNASLAVLTVKKIFQEIAKEQIIAGLGKVILNTGIQGRYERYSEKPNIIFDSAHNIEGIEVFLKEYSKEVGNYSKSILIYGAMNDKSVSEILVLLNKYFDEIYSTEIDYERALSRTEIVEMGKDVNVEIIPLDNVAEYINEFKKMGNDKSLVVLGSMYILGEIKKMLKS